MVINIQAVADLGYISFYYGCRNPGEWEIAKYQYKDCLLLADARSFRSDIIEDYKARRKLNRETRPQVQQTYLKVKALREHILQNDFHSQVAQVPGAEADDLVAAFHLAYPDLRYIVAIDKDYLQLPGFNAKQYSATMEQFPIKEIFTKLPQYVSKGLTEITPPLIVLIHALFGDKSDSIPRLLSSHVTLAKSQWSSIFSGDSLLSMYQRAHTMFRSDFVTNLNLVVLPGNLLRNEPLDSTSLIHSIADQSYWNPESWSELIQQALISVEERSSSITELMSDEWSDLDLG